MVKRTIGIGLLLIIGIIQVVSAAQYINSEDGEQILATTPKNKNQDRMDKMRALKAQDEAEEEASSNAFSSSASSITRPVTGAHQGSFRSERSSSPLSMSKRSSSPSVQVSGNLKKEESENSYHNRIAKYQDRAALMRARKAKEEGEQGNSDLSSTTQSITSEESTSSYDEKKNAAEFEELRNRYIQETNKMYALERRLKSSTNLLTIDERAFPDKDMFESMSPEKLVVAQKHLQAADIEKIKATHAKGVEKRKQGAQKVALLQKELNDTKEGLSQIRARLDQLHDIRTGWKSRS
jgi:hypothetical protein